ncbi:5-formyltetrahydrofolate cyclo-ligase [Planctomycetales bacterium ZRK34]|nr:5-formyltetrahydrofolate cyclo-ligase [Planctomycetales bacterium ZRK34]
MPAERKKQMRRQLRQWLSQLDPQQVRTRSQNAAHRLIQTDAFAQATTVMLYLPLTGEVDTRPIALRAWQDDKTVTVPLISHEQKHMIPVTLRSFEEPMNLDHLGVRSPRTGEPMPISMIDLVLVPGLGFDRNGRRLGRGAGFFDRFLARPDFGGVVCGVAFDEQVVDELPTDVHDVSMQMIVTDRQVLWLNPEQV